MSLTVDGVWKSGVWASTAWASGVWSEGGTPVVAAATAKARSGGAKSPSLRKRRRIPRVIFLPTEDGKPIVVEKAEEPKPLRLAVQKIFVDARVQEFKRPQMADVDRLIAKMNEYRPVILPSVRPEYYDEEDEDEEWLLMH